MTRFEQLINELHHQIVDEAIPDLDTNNLNYIFGDQMRIAEVVASGQKFKIPIEEILDEYNIDFESWVAYKKTDTERRQPTKINKLLNKQKQKISKQGGDTEKIDQLLNIYDLKGQTNVVEDGLVLVYSRAPIDVARMGDHTDIESCHSPNDEYFNCALSDAQNQAGIVYLISLEAYGEIKDNLQAKEIFTDEDRGMGWIEPMARIRLRVLVDGEGHDQVIPSLSIYGDTSFEKIFKEEVTKWARSHINPKFNWDGELTRIGGSYEDGGVKVSEALVDIFGKDLRSDIKFKNTEIEFRRYNNFKSREELEEETREVEEYFLDWTRGWLYKEIDFTNFDMGDEDSENLVIFKLDLQTPTIRMRDFDYTTQDGDTIRVRGDGTIDIEISVDNMFTVEETINIIEQQLESDDLLNIGAENLRSLEPEDADYTSWLMDTYYPFLQARGVKISGEYIDLMQTTIEEHVGLEEMDDCLLDKLEFFVNALPQMDKPLGTKIEEFSWSQVGGEGGERNQNAVEYRNNMLNSIMDGLDKAQIFNTLIKTFTEDNGEYMENYETQLDEVIADKGRIIDSIRTGTRVVGNAVTPILVIDIPMDISIQRVDTSNKLTKLFLEMFNDDLNETTTIFGEVWDNLNKFLGDAILKHISDPEVQQESFYGVLNRIK